MTCPHLTPGTAPWCDDADPHCNLAACAERCAWCGPEIRAERGDAL